MTTRAREARARPPALAVSVTWGYAFGFLLLAFVLLVLVPEPEGPSPWDAVAFRAAVLELFANFRLLDELADLGIVRVADVGNGFLNVDLGLLAVSNRSFGWAPFVLAIGFVSLSLLLRGLRQRLVAEHVGLSSDARGRTASYFFGRGMNLFFPFGPGDLATARALDGGAGDSRVAGEVVFFNRVLELVAILGILLVGLVLLGWGGAVVAVAWTVFLVVVTVSLTQPLGWTVPPAASWNLAARLWSAFGGHELRHGVERLARSPGFFVGAVLVSLAAMFLEVLGYWSIKQAFSSPLDDYVLMSDLSFLSFTIVVTVAGITRIIPYTFASFGVYETVSIVMFWVMGESFLGGATVSLLDSALLNVITLIFLVVSMQLVRFPSMLETWRMFYRRSADTASA